jgi:hypothetical protein
MEWRTASTNPFDAESFVMIAVELVPDPSDFADVKKPANLSQYDAKESAATPAVSGEEEDLGACGIRLWIRHSGSRGQRSESERRRRETMKKDKVTV